MRIHLLILFIATSFSAYSQLTIKGQVLSKANETLPGVDVLEKGTNNRTVTDADGTFEIRCNSTHAVLVFSFIGLKTVELNAANNMIVYMTEDEKAMKEKIRWGFYSQYTGVGLSSGVSYTPVGVRIENALPVLFGLKMLTTTAINYRTDLDDNRFFDVRLRKHDLIKGPYYQTGLNIALAYNERQISDSDEVWRIQEFNVIPEVAFNSFFIRAGYGQQSFNDVEKLGSNPGIIIGLGKYFMNTSLIATTKKWNGYWQTEIEFIRYAKKTDFEYGGRLEILDRYKELDLFISYNIHY